MKQPAHNGIFFLIALFLISLLSSACRVEGPPGPPGIPGLPGRDGNPEVFSINYSIIDADWFDVGTPGTEGYFLAVDLDVPEITQSIVDDGLVLVYFREDETSPWIALPYTVISHNPQFIEKLDFIYSLEFVGLQSMATDMNATPWEGFFRIIVASGIRINKKEVDYSNYDEVADWLGLADAIEVEGKIRKDRD